MNAPWLLRATFLRTGLWIGLWICEAHTAVYAANATVAVAANFKPTLDNLVEIYEDRHEHDITIVTGSTGKLYAQIRRGAPFDVFLAADAERPALLSADGLARSPFTYANGVLVLIGSGDADVLANGRFARLAIANPKLAPYGLAAANTLHHMGVYERYESRLVFGENIGQALAMVATGNTDLGLVSLAQARLTSRPFTVISSDMHEPIRQDGVLLRRGYANLAAVSFVEFIQTQDAKHIVREAGYLL